MNLEFQRMTAGLVFERHCDCTIEDVMPHVAAALDAFDVPVTGKTLVSETCAIVQVPGRLIHLALAPDTWTPRAGPDDHILHVCVEDRSSDTQGPKADILLAEMTTRLFVALCPSHVTWLDAAMLTHKEFAEITGARPIYLPNHKPAPARKAEILPAINDSHCPVLDRCEAEEEAAMAAWHYRVHREEMEDMPGIILDMPDSLHPGLEDIRDASDSSRLSAWFFAIGVSSIAPPLGAALATVNLLKGENLRLASQSAALLGLFSALNASGANAETLELVERMFG